MGNQRITIFDTTLRDGEQSPGCSMNLDEKLQMALQLEALGVDVIEAGFPVASDDDFAAVQAIARECRKPIIAALCRTIPKDIDRAWEALREAARPRIHTFLATSDIHLAYKLQKTREEALQMVREGVSRAKSHCQEVEFSAEDATRSDWDYLVQVFTVAIEAGATVLNVPDTVGYTVPDEYSKLITYLRERVPGIEDVTISVHCHNDLGLAVANSLAAVSAGARQVECTMNGIGERAGNAALEEVVMALSVRRDAMPYTTGVNQEAIYRTSQTLANITGIEVQPNKAIVGRNAFAHESGIHQHGMLSHRSTYEIMTPESVGVRQTHLVLGKHSGRHALAKRFEELGYPLERAELDKAYKLFTKLSDQKKEIFDEDLLAIVRDGLTHIPETFKLRALQATAGTSMWATALVTLASEEGEHTETAMGDGPVNAVFAAVDKLTGLKGRLLDFRIHAITGGADAVGEVFIQVEFDGVAHGGKGASTDIVEASVRAYLNATNKVLFSRRALATPVPAEARS
ncbi:2-isopropylmalate synthase [Geothrix sp. PMB-07]|uniref:2-isopropylmalate synthase n=1 Tax=Geothrix sp. PMB-07 TaxID=3068640 RepID=UPI0027427AEC|nr:2-isopropylmalate synthase [Geothrix sp. PMB-07]WLT30217.1 2-isopropylmalate synthase [Geothrix sp. PMB-07]